MLPVFGPKKFLETPKIWLVRAFTISKPSIFGQKFSETRKVTFSKKHFPQVQARLQRTCIPEAVFFSKNNVHFFFTPR